MISAGGCSSAAVEWRWSTGEPVLALGGVGPHSRQVSARPAADRSLQAMCASGGHDDPAGGSVAGCTGSPERQRYGREVEGMRRRRWLQLVVSEEALRKENNGAL